MKFLSNETSATREGFMNKLNKLGFELKLEDIFTPAPFAKDFITEKNLRPHLLVHDGRFFFKCIYILLSYIDAFSLQR